MWLFPGGKKEQETKSEKKFLATPGDIRESALQLEHYINGRASIIDNESIILILRIIDLEFTICNRQTMQLPQSTCYTLYNIVQEYIPNLIESYCNAHGEEKSEAHILHTNIMQMLDSIIEIKKAVEEDNQNNLEIETRFLESKFERNSIEDVN